MAKSEIHYGRVINGEIVLNDPNALPDGTRVTVRLLKGKRRPTKGKGQSSSLLERLKPVIGVARGLPKDLAKNHDHYLHGLPKK